MAIYLSLERTVARRGRFLLISLVIALITLLVLFVAGLAEGLGSGNIEYLSKFERRPHCVPGEFAIIDQRQPARSLEAGRRRAPRRRAGRGAAGLQQRDDRAARRPQAAGCLADRRRAGQAGRSAGARRASTFDSRRANEAVIDRNTALRTGLKVGDIVTLKAVQGTKEEFYTLTVVGISDGQQYLAAAVGVRARHHVGQSTAAQRAVDRMTLPTTCSR